MEPQSLPDDESESSRGNVLPYHADLLHLCIAARNSFLLFFVLNARFLMTSSPCRV